MTPSREGRSRRCAEGEARDRLDRAREWLRAAERETYVNAAVANAVRAGIAACDAACCKALERRSKGEDHRQAGVLVAQIEPDGKEAAGKLGRLLAVKNDADYGLDIVSGEKHHMAIRQARALVAFAETVLRR